ncbi:MAG: diguanylate cyclase domain-containing protein, partial [bacterium]
LFYNTAFEETASGTGMFANVFSPEILRKPQPHHLLSEKIIHLADYVRANGDGRMLETFGEQYYEIKARCVAKTRGRYCVLLRITNLTKASQSDTTRYLDEFVRRIYALYERITLINLADDTIRPLYALSREDLVSDRKGIKNLVVEYAETYIFPEDQEKYIKTFDPETAVVRFRETSCESFSEVLRARMLHGKYDWKEYTLLRIDDGNYFMLVRNISESTRKFINMHSTELMDGGVYSPAHLWTSLVTSDFIRLFWKDQDRRFLGASRAFLDYYGFASADEIIGKNDEELGWHVHPDLYMNDEYRVIRTGVTIRDVPGLCMNDGENKEILASKMPIYDIHGDIRGLMGYFIDRDMLNKSEKLGKDSTRRDALTGLLNSRGISEESSNFRDEYELRGTDFVRIHIAVNDFGALNEQYGYDFGDKVLGALGQALKDGFGRTSAVGRYSGNHFVVLHQIMDNEEVYRLRSRIKEIGSSIQNVENTPVTLYLSVGYVLFSETMDLDEQTRLSEIRLHADHDQNISAESRLTHSTEIFQLFDDLPLSYSVYHVTHAEHSGLYDAVIFYVNHKYEELGGLFAKDILGHSVREILPYTSEEWFMYVKRAAIDGEKVDAIYTEPRNGKKYHLLANQIIYQGYCAVTFQEILTE